MIKTPTNKKRYNVEYKIAFSSKEVSVGKTSDTMLFLRLMKSLLYNYLLIIVHKVYSVCHLDIKLAGSVGELLLGVVILEANFFTSIASLGYSDLFRITLRRLICNNNDAEGVEEN
uniref:Uncharacterized protein n=1 Tax=Glossina pallidipes TaxID=7398 RepID=A0A1B0AC88_GLOPL